MLHISEIASREHISRTQLQNWRKEFLDNVALVFSQSKAEKQKKSSPVLDTLKTAIARYGYPAIINSDQSSQFTSKQYTQYLQQNEICQSMDA